jgi:hypothetical protein
LKTVYFIASHVNPGQVLRLASVLEREDPDADVVIHHDCSKTEFPAEELRGMPRVCLMDRHVPARWGDISLVEMTLAGMEWIAARGQFDWLVFLSGQDYPIQSLASIRNELANSPFDAFMTGVAIESGQPCGRQECPLSTALGAAICLDCRERYLYGYHSAPGANLLHKLPSGVTQQLERARKWINRNQSFLNIRTAPPVPGQAGPLGLRPLPPLFTDRFRCYKGSQWFTLNERSLYHILRFNAANPRFMRHYRRTIMPDESFFQTILMNEPSLHINTDPKRFISWLDFHAPSPEILTAADFGRITASGCHFARKFDALVDSDILDMLDRHRNPSAASARPRP